MHLRRWLALLIISTAFTVVLPATAQDDGLAHQWAVGASATSEYSTSDYSALQATGQPDTRQCTDSVAAWASAGIKNPKEALTVYFEIPVWATQVNIHQNFTPGAITGIDLLPATGGDPISVPNSADPGTRCPGILSIDLPGDIPTTINGVVIYLDQRTVGNWNEIDAVELVGVWPSGEDATGPTTTVSNNNGTTTSTQQTTVDSGPSGKSVSCDNGASFDNGVEVRVIQMRAGYTYTATAIGLNGFDPVLAVLDTAGRGLCSDDDSNAAAYTAFLPTSGEAPAAGTSAQVFFANNSNKAFENVSLVVGGLDNMSGEFILILEGMVLTTADGAGDAFSMQITPGMINSGVSPSVYMISVTNGLDPLIAMIDADYNFLKEDGSKGNYYACDNAGYSTCWGESYDLSNYYVSRSGGRGVPGGSYDAMLRVSPQAGNEWTFYNFLMRSAGMQSFGDYVVAFHIGIG
ncbi:MAG: hypothetical protein R3E39_11795 [Anaerolineae bacterium]